MDDISSFADLGLRPDLLEVLTQLGYEEPTPIQCQTVPPLIEGRDLLGQAPTGTGKTAAFALPILQRLADGDRGKEPVALVLVPTRELAVQVSEAMHKYGARLGARVVPIYGGQPIGRQLMVLDRGVDVVVATPGRALDHLARGTLRMGGLATVVLDEADEMLDMGFADDIEALLQAAPAERQTVLFSATMPARIDGMARRHLREPVRIALGRQDSTPGGASPVQQTAYLVPRGHKPAALGRILDVESPTAAVVFCRTRAEVDQLTATLNGRGHRAEALHGGMDQAQRDRVMGRLRSGQAELLLATDVAARGLDVEQLTHVVNYDVPAAPDVYVHRIGRVGRAGREGVAITLVEPREHRMIKAIERVTKQKIPVEQLPTVADLRSRRLELTRASLEELLVEDDLEHFRIVVETLSDEHDLFQIAMAAVKLAHEATTTGADDDIPEAEVHVDGDRRGPRERPGRKGAPARQGSAGMTRLYVGAGRIAGIRPQDLVGAIAGETDLSGRDIGSIEISDRFSLVEVPDASVDHVIERLGRTTIKGKKPNVRRERF